MSSPTSSAVRPILPVPVGRTGISYAQGMAAGPWVFATGHMAQTYPGGIADDVLSTGLPHSGLPRHQKEAGVIFSRIEEVFREAGTDLSNVVRVDQYYPDFRAVDQYHIVRRQRLPTIPPSTSMLMSELSIPEAGMNVQAIGIVPGTGFQVEHTKNPSIDAHPTSGYSAALCAGDYVFVAGMTPSAKPGQPSRNGIADAAQMPDGMLWRGTPIMLETDFIINEKIIPALESVGSSLKNVCKAQVYLVHAEDTAPFLQVWNRYFGDNPPALSIMPCANPGIGQSAARIEINILAIRDNAPIKKEIIGDDVFTGYEGVPGGVRAGDLLFLSGLMAVDRHGLVPTARPDTEQPYLFSSSKAQMRAILERASDVCELAGTSLANVLRIQHFHTDLADLLPALEVWQEFLPGSPLPFTAVRVPDAMPAPGVSLIADLWVYAPPANQL